MDKQQIIEALAREYRGIYARWNAVSCLAKEAAQDGDDEAFRAIDRRAWKLSHNLDGMKAAARALGISEEEFMTAVSTDREGVKS